MTASEQRKALAARFEAARNEWYRLQRETMEAGRHTIYLNRELELFDQLHARVRVIA